MVRTQLYLTEAQREGLNRVAQEVGRSQSDLIREAIDRFLAVLTEPDWKERLHQAHGVWAGRADLDELMDNTRRSFDRGMSAREREKAWALLEEAGTDEPPREGDELDEPPPR